MSEGPAAVGDVHQGLVRLQSSPCSCRQTSSSVPTNSLIYRISLGRKARFSSSLSRRKGLGLLQSGARICLLFHVGCPCPAALEASRLFAERSMAPLLAGPSTLTLRYCSAQRASDYWRLHIPATPYFNPDSKCVLHARPIEPIDGPTQSPIPERHPRSVRMRFSFRRGCKPGMPPPNSSLYRMF